MARGKQTRIKGGRKAQRLNQTWLLSAVVLAIVSFSGYLLTRPGTRSETRLPREIPVQEAAGLWEAGTFVLDVRQPEEWIDHHIPGTTLIPLGELERRLDELPRQEEIVVVCRSGNRSATGRDILLAAGFKQVTSMAGGLNMWRAAGYPTVSGP